MRFVELNHVLGEGMPAHPSFPEPVISAYLDHETSRSRYQGQAEFHIDRYDFVGAAGTYLDSPFHRHRDGDDLSVVTLDRVAGLAGVCLQGDVGPDRSVRCVVPPNATLAGRAVLVSTGWDRRWGRADYWEPGPFLGADLLDLLLDARPALVGVDFCNVDDTLDPSRPAHTRLLARGILIVEHLCGLESLCGLDSPRKPDSRRESDSPRAPNSPRDSGFRFFAVPLRIVGGASFPVRAFAEIAED